MSTRGVLRLDFCEVVFEIVDEVAESTFLSLSLRFPYVFHSAAVVDLVVDASVAVVVVVAAVATVAAATTNTT